jgi:multidrug resistance efflux pump
MMAAKAALADAQAALDTAELRFRDLYEVLEALAEEVKADKESVTGAPVFELSVYVAALAAEYEDSSDTVEVDGETYVKSELSDAYTAINSAKAEVESCQRAYDEACETYNNSTEGGNAARYDKLAKILANAQQDLAEAQTELTVRQEIQADAETFLTEEEARMTEYKEAVATAKQAQTALEDKIFALQEQQKEDNKNLTLQTLQINKLKDQIADAEDELERLRGGAVDAAVVSKVNGVVKSLGVSAGNTTEPGTPLATILVPDRGYAVSITVTADQAKKVTVGDSAEVTTGWWGGSDITARLASIRPDPSAPNQNRILVFDIGGEVEDGTQLSLSVGQKSKNYDIVVPNSAVRSDTNGDFVLVVVAKSSPLGNRYIATRADVQVLGADDLSTAVSGGVANGDFVITTSTRPLESGMQVRLAEG